jgi:ribosomal protein S18 acetylase RimI-like enzyme
MSELVKEAYGPTGDPDRHLPMWDLQARFAALAAPPRDAGLAALVVCRQADGTRVTPPSVHLSPQGGVPGDGWSRRPPRHPDAQITVMRRDVAELVANGQPLTVFGDNLFVDLDLADANLPAGTRLRVGGAVVEVTPRPHNGCNKFKGRFGADALAFVQAGPTRSLNLRGIHVKVIEPGELRVPGPVQVISRGRPMALTVRRFVEADGAAVQDLWAQAFPDDPPRNAPVLAIARKLQVQPELFFVAALGDVLVGAVMAGYDGVRGWIYHLAVGAEWRRRGFATALVREAESALACLGCPKVNLQVRGNNAELVAFYRKLGFVVEDRVSLGRVLDARGP